VLGISYQQVQKYEQGVSRIGAGRLQQLAEILNVPVSVFFDKNSVDRNMEVPCSHSSTPPIRFVSLRHLRKYWIVASSSALWNWSNKSPTGTALSERRLPSIHPPVANQISRQRAQEPPG
jgi:transcriptional regulator with XRE-family HTH domain